MMKEGGLMVRSRALRETSQPPGHGGLNKLISTYHDPMGTVKAATTRTVLPEVDAQCDICTVQLCHVLLCHFCSAGPLSLE